MVANVNARPSRQLSQKTRRLLLVRRAMKKLETMNAELRADVHNLMDAEHIEEVKIPSGTVKRYESEIHDIDPKALHRAIGKDAWQFMKVRVGEAKKALGKTQLRRLLRLVDVQERLLTKPAPKPKTMKVSV